MSAITYQFFVGDATGKGVTGLTPSWSSFLSVTSTPTTPVPITPQPTVAEIGGGHYEYSYDPYTNGAAVGALDLGSGLTAAVARYIPQWCGYAAPVQPQDITAIAAAAGGSGGLTLAGLMNAALAAYETPGTTGAALNKLLVLALTGAGGVTVGGYASGEDPATLLLANPGDKILTDSAGRMTVGGYESGLDPATLVWSALAASFEAAGSFGAFIQALPTVAGFVTGLLDEVNGIETGVTPRQALRAIVAAMAGILTGAGTNTISISAAGNPGTVRIVLEADSSGNRSNVTLTL
jgi:hypothetical protein